MKEKIATMLKGHIHLSEESIIKLLEIPPTPELGDFALPCFALIKIYKKDPTSIAKDLATKIKSSLVEKVEAKGPYINFFLNRKILAKQILTKILGEKENYGQGKKSNETIMIEFSQANTHKAFHVGHVRGTLLGESLARITEWAGRKVIRVNYQGDIGMHVAKWLWYYTTFRNHERLRENEAWIASLYVDALKKLAEHPEYQKDSDEINRKLDQRSDKKLLALWKKTRQLSLNAFKPIYKELDTWFDHCFFESRLEEPAKQITQKLLEKGIAQISEGATIVDLEKYNLGVWVLLRRDGSVLYSAKDLALAEKKFNEFKINKSIYVIGSEQQLHIAQLFKTLELTGISQVKKCHYVPISLVRLPHGKMSSRTGDNILYSQFKAELVHHALAEIKSRHDLNQKDAKKRALTIALAALKYSFLKQDTNKTIVFDKIEALRFDGNTGPYMLYTYARARSILRKARYKQKKKIALKTNLEEREKSLILKLASFPEVTQQAYASYAPALIANYAYELAQLFNEFYHATKVIGSENEFVRLALVDATAQIIKNSLFLLTIPVLERM